MLDKKSAGQQLILLLSSMSAHSLAPAAEVNGSPFTAHFISRLADHSNDILIYLSHTQIETYVEIYYICFRSGYRIPMFCGYPLTFITALGKHFFTRWPVTKVVEFWVEPLALPYP